MLKRSLLFLAFVFSTTALADGELKSCKDRCRTEFKDKPEALRVCKAQCEEKWNNPKPVNGGAVPAPKLTEPSK